MISVAKALARILAPLPLMPAETVALDVAAGRVLAEDAVARLTQPAVSVSAMDGYAVRAEDLAEVPARLTCVGEAPAGAAYAGTLRAGQAVRIFTGAPLPDGADAIVIQENTERADGSDEVVMRETVARGRYVREAGLDFSTGDVGIPTGTRMAPRHVALAAAMNIPWLMVRRKPRIALLATGDEIVRPGDPIAPSQIVSSNALGLTGLVRSAGGEAIDLGIARDNEASLRALAAGARGADMLVTLGGASVGDHDLVKEVLGEIGLDLDFWKIAMRPGKPLMFGRFADAMMLGLPGNPVSSLVCGLIFLAPAIHAMLGLSTREAEKEFAPLAHDLAANDEREDYLRARLLVGDDGTVRVAPFEKQDSSMLSTMASADCLALRPPHAAAAKAGEEIEIIRLDAGQV